MTRRKHDVFQAVRREAVVETCPNIDEGRAVRSVLLVQATGVDRGALLDQLVYVVASAVAADAVLELARAVPGSDAVVSAVAIARREAFGPEASGRRLSAR